MINIPDTLKQYIKEIPYAGDRIKICHQCENYDEEKFTCKTCGCYIYSKVIFKPINCPVGKW